jgi:hypothetical protein
MFLFGTLCNALVLRFLLGEKSLGQLAFERALLTAEDVVWNPFYNYARLLSGTMSIGAWGMLLFSGKDQIRKQVAIAANFLVVLFPVIFGGRMSLIRDVLALAVLYHYGVRRIRLRHIAIVATVLIVGLSAIQFLRYRVAGLSEALVANLADVFVTGGINEAAFALRMFPEQIPFLGLGGLIGPLSHLFPTLGDHLPGARSIWMFLVDYLFGGRNPARGIGGEHYAPAAEHYMLFGFSGVVLLGLAYGLLYGHLFVWQKRQPENLFILMLVTYAWKAFFVSVIDGKMAAWVGGMGFGALLPVGVLAATTYSHRMSEIALFGPLYLCALSFFLKRLSGLDLFDYTFAAALVPAYIISLKVIGRASPTREVVKFSRMARVTTTPIQVGQVRQEHVD